MENNKGIQGYSAKVVLHSHPHFYNPGLNRKKELVERIVRFFWPVHSLVSIARHCLKNDISICAISAFNGGSDPLAIDHRFEEYMLQLPLLDKEFEIGYNKEEMWVSLDSKSGIDKERRQRVILLHTQEVGTTYKDNRADINVIGARKLICGRESLEETVKQANGEGGFVIIAHPSSKACSTGVEKAIEMIHAGQALTAEGWNALESPETNETAKRELENAGIYNWVSVPDSHYYRQNTSAYVMVRPELVYNFSTSGLAECVRQKDFSTYEGTISGCSKFLTHKLPIILTTPGHLILDKERRKRQMSVIKQIIKSKIGLK
jgi:hypothetical protein